MATAYNGMICKDCEKPFWVWPNDEAVKRIDSDRVQMYLNEGHTKDDNISHEVMSDINKWCACPHSKDIDEDFKE